MRFRIGIDVGDIVFEGDRLYGDEINIGARIEGLAGGGGIYLSGTVCDQLAHKLPVWYEELGGSRQEYLRACLSVSGPDEN